MEEKKESKALHKIHIPHDHGHATEDILDVMPKIQDFMDASEMFSQIPQGCEFCGFFAIVRNALMILPQQLK